LQLVGYLVTLWTSLHEEYGWRDAVTGGAFAVVALGAALAFDWVYGKARLRPTLVEMAHYLGDETRLEHPRADMLHCWGATGLGIEQPEGESRHAFLRRVFRVEDAVVPIDGRGFRPIAENE
jgi:hypothetical protein